MFVKFSVGQIRNWIYEEDAHKMAQGVLKGRFFDPTNDAINYYDRTLDRNSSS